jgi:hypothetical protein
MSVRNSNSKINATTNNKNQNNNKTNNNSTTTKKKDQLINKLQKQVARLTLLSKRPFNQSTWYHSRDPTLFKQVNDYHDNMLAEYVYGLFHPDAVYRENLNIKAPSILPIPTTNFAFKETFTISPNSYGNFLLVWSPNYLGSMDKIPKVMNQTQIDGESAVGYFSNIYYDVSNDLDGNSNAQHYQAQTFKHINQVFNKYRLTSACVKVKYTGKVLNQSGMMSACASFMEFPRTAICMKQSASMTSTYEIPNLYPQLQRLGDFDIIRQGQWAKTISIVDEPSGITCVYIPTDTLSQAFVDNAETLTEKGVSKFYPLSPVGGVGTQWYSRNANISFDICGYGIVNDASDVPCITVECYYNYEIIVNEDQLSFFRPTTPKIEMKEAEGVQRLTQQVASTVGSITTTKMHDQPNIMTKIQNAIATSRRWFNNIEPLINVLKLGIKLI